MRKFLGDCFTSTTGPGIGDHDHESASREHRASPCTMASSPSKRPWTRSWLRPIGTELIISDNASTDRTSEIARAYAAKDERIRLHRDEANPGLAGNHNRVFALARGGILQVGRGRRRVPARLPGPMQTIERLLRHKPKSATKNVVKIEEYIDMKT